MLMMIYPKSKVLSAVNGCSSGACGLAVDLRAVEKSLQTVAANPLQCGLLSNHQFMNSAVKSVFLFVVMGANAASAQVYKWVDEHGVTHYSQTKPADDAEEIKVKGMKSAKDREAFSATSATSYGRISERASTDVADVNCDQAVRHSSKILVEDLKASSSGQNNPFADVLTDPKFIIDTIAECNREIQDPVKAAIWLCQQNASTAKEIELCES
jgi:hypothetical protein